MHDETNQESPNYPALYPTYPHPPFPCQARCSGSWGHLDSTFRGWSATLATGVRLVIAGLVLIFALPLDFHWRLRVIRSVCIPGALHGIEASFLSEASLRELRTAIVRVVWSRNQSLANTGAVLISLLGGPSGCDPALCVVLFRFRMLRRYLACRPGEVPGVSVA